MGLTAYELSYDKQPFVRHHLFITAHNITKFPSALPMRCAQLNECIRITVRQSLQHMEGPAARKNFGQVGIVVHTLGVPHVVYPPRLQHSKANAKHHVPWEALHQVLTIVRLQAQSHALQDGLEHEVPHRHGGRTIRGAPKEALPNTEGLPKVTQCPFRRQCVSGCLWLLMVGWVDGLMDEWVWVWVWVCFCACVRACTFGWVGSGHEDMCVVLPCFCCVAVLCLSP